MVCFAWRGIAVVRWGAVAFALGMGLVLLTGALRNRGSSGAPERVDREVGAGALPEVARAGVAHLPGGREAAGPQDSPKPPVAAVSARVDDAPPGVGEDARALLARLKEIGRSGPELERVIDRLARSIDRDPAGVAACRECILSGRGIPDWEVFGAILALGRAGRAEGHQALLEVARSRSLPEQVRALGMSSLGQRRENAGINRWEVCIPHCTFGYRIGEDDVRRELVGIYREELGPRGYSRLRSNLVNVLCGSVDDPEVASALKDGLACAVGAEEVRILDSLHGVADGQLSGLDPELLARVRDSSLGDAVAHAATLLLRQDPDRNWPPVAAAMRRLLALELSAGSSDDPEDRYSSASELGHALSWLSRDLPEGEALRQRFVRLLCGDLAATRDRGQWLAALARQVGDGDGEEVWEPLLLGLESPELKRGLLRNALTLLVVRRISAENAARILAAVAGRLRGASEREKTGIARLVHGWPSMTASAEQEFLLSLAPGSSGPVGGE